MRNVSIFFVLLSGLASAVPMTNQQASDAGKLLGQQQDALITPQINQTNANAKIKHVTGNPPETQFFGGGKADNFGAGDAKRIACDTGAKNPDPFTQQSCDAVNTIARAPKQRPAYTIGRNDPILQREQDVRKKPPLIGTTGPGNPNGFGQPGFYSGCTTTTTPDPGTTEIKLCTDYLSKTQTTTTNACQKSTGSTQTCHQVMSFTVSQPAPIPATGTTTVTPSCGYIWGYINTSCVPGNVTYSSPPTANRIYTFTATTTDCTNSLLYDYSNNNYNGAYAYLVIGIGGSFNINTVRTNTPGVCMAGYYQPGGQNTRGPVTVMSWSTISTTTYSCPAGYTLFGTSCVPPPVVTETFTDNCTTLQAKTL